MLQIENLSFSYVTKTHITHIFNKISLRLPNQGLCVLEGENGIGKTTLFKLIGRTISPSEGTIKFCNSRAYTLAWMEQHASLVSHLSLNKFWRVFQSLIHPLQWNKRRETELFSSLNMHTLLTTKVGLLSGGEKQRLHFMMTLMTPASIYLFDEPGASMDVMLHEVIASWIDKIAREALVLVITHHPKYFDGYGYHKVKFTQNRLECIPNPMEVNAGKFMMVTQKRPPKIAIASLFTPPKLPQLLTQLIPILGTWVLIGMMWVTTAVDQAFFDYHAINQSSLFIQIEARESEHVDGSPWEWVHYRSLQPSEQTSMAMLFRETLFLPDYRSVVIPIRIIDDQVWQCLPYDDRGQEKPVGYVTHPINLTSIQLVEEDDRSDIELIVVPPPRLGFLPSSPTLYYPYFWLYERLTDTITKEPQNHVWWFIPKDDITLDFIKTIHLIQEETNLVFRHSSLMEYKLYAISKPLWSTLTMVFGSIYLLGWWVVDGLVIERWHHHNQIAREWIIKRPHGHHFLHHMWRINMIYDFLYLLTVVGLFFILFRFWLSSVGLPWSMTWEPWGLLLGMVIYLLYRMTLYEVLVDKTYDSHR